jgi:hypothetical protein
MPRPDKDIDPGRLDGTLPSSRSHSWTKYGDAETVDGPRGAPSTVEVTVDDITVAELPDVAATKYTTRDTASHDVGPPDDGITKPRIEVVQEWVVHRTIEERIYHRTDRLVMVELDG